MSDRYSRLFTLPVNLYTSGSPVLIQAGALLKDNQTGKVLAQLKIKNIMRQAVKAVTVHIQPLDTVGNLLGDAVSFQYLDLNAGRGEDFGTKTPVMLPNVATRSFLVSVTEVVFQDHTIWHGTEEVWKELPAAETLEDGIKHRELVEQYRIQFGADCKYSPVPYKDLWRCACGEWNRQEETHCYNCRKNAESLLNVDLEKLKQQRDCRLARQQEIAAQERAAA